MSLYGWAALFTNKLNADRLPSTAEIEILGAHMTLHRAHLNICMFGRLTSSVKVTIANF